MKKAMVITGLTKHYRNGRGISTINLEISQGEILGILGPNGAGKTTLLKCMSGLIKPDSGTIEFFGIDLTSNFKKAIQPVSSLIGPAQGYEHMTAYQNLKLISRFYPNIPLSRLDKVLEMTGLLEYKHEKIMSFSMGMKQRYGIASVLLSNPRFIILDEPTNGLDIDGILLLQNLIKDISNQSGVTFVISSHHLSEIEKWCTRFCFLHNGHISFYQPDGQSLEEIYLKKGGEQAYENSPSQHNK